MYWYKDTSLSKPTWHIHEEFVCQCYTVTKVRKCAEQRGWSILGDTLLPWKWKCISNRYYIMKFYAWKYQRKTNRNKNKKNSQSARNFIWHICYMKIIPIAILNLNTTQDLGLSQMGNLRRKWPDPPLESVQFACSMHSPFLSTFHVEH